MTVDGEMREQKFISKRRVSEKNPLSAAREHYIDLCQAAT